jgi:hypothetical protein
MAADNFQQYQHLISLLSRGEHGLAHIEKLKMEVSAGEITVEQIIHLCFHPQQKIAFHAAWLLEGLVIDNWALILPHLSYFIDSFPKINNLSVKRHFTKILLLLEKEGYSFQDHFDCEAMIAICFDWLISAKTPVAVKANCISVLAVFSKKEIWIKDELLLLIDQLTPLESIAFFARATKVKKQLLQQD